MTEAEWQAATDPTPMVEFLEEKASERKLRLFALACCRRHAPHDPNPLASQAVRWAEGVIEGVQSMNVLTRMAGRLARPAEECGSGGGYQRNGGLASALRHISSRFSSFQWMDCFQSAEAWDAAPGAEYQDDDQMPSEVGWQEAFFRERRSQAASIQDVFGNPFRPVAVDPSWLTSTVVALATGIYQDRAFDRMPILADALQDAGCDNEDILNHCRGDGPHVRGCWVIDLILGKE